MAVAVRVALGSIVAGVVPFATIFPAIIVAAVAGGIGPGVTAIVAGGFASWFFFLTPAELAVPTMQEAVSLLLYVTSGLLILVIIADRRASETSLRRERDRAKLYFETAGVMLVVLRADRRVRAINKFGAEILGVPATAVLGQDWVYNFIPERLRPKAVDIFETCLRGAADSPACREGVVLRADGSERLIAWRNTLLQDAEGRAIGILSSGEDVTERQVAEQGLRDSEARFRALTESMPQLVWSTHPDGNCDYLSRQWVEYTGMPEEQHHGLGWQQAIHPEDRHSVAEAWAAAIKNDSNYDVKYRLRGRDGGYRWFAARGHPLRDEQGGVTRWFGTSTDITEIVEARQGLEQRVGERTRELEEMHRRLLDEVAERAKAEAALARAQRLEAIGQLTGGVAHDFNNLLTVIVGNLDMIVRAANNPDRVRRLATTALGAADRGEAVTRQLLAFARQQALKPEIVELNSLIRKFEEIARRATGEATEVRLDLAEDAFYCDIDPAQFETALLNLVVNARDATPPGGEITIATRLARSEADGASASFPSGDYAVVLVRDTGRGIPGDVLPRVYDPFFTTKEVGKGSGLGLSQVYGFVSQSGGNIRIDSKIGAGTTVHICLPITRPKATPDPRPSRLEDAGSGNGETLLVVEDDPEVLQIAVATIRGLGFAVLVARNGPEALEILKMSQRIDLLFTDVVMPRGMTGVELARHARELRPGLPVLLTSGYSAPGLSDVTDDVPLLRKPYRIADLARAIRDALDRCEAATAAPPSEPRVLLVEDDPLVRLSAMALLEECGFQVVGDAPSGEIALSQLPGLQTDGGIDVLFTDFSLPGMNGRTLAEEARRRLPQLKVVLATGYDCQASACDESDLFHLAKPFGRPDIERIRALLTQNVGNKSDLGRCNGNAQSPG